MSPVFFVQRANLLLLLLLLCSRTSTRKRRWRRNRIRAVLVAAAAAAGISQTNVAAVKISCKTSRNSNSSSSSIIIVVLHSRKESADARGMIPSQDLQCAFRGCSGSWHVGQQTRGGGDASPPHAAGSSCGPPTKVMVRSSRRGLRPYRIGFVGLPSSS